MDCRRLKLVFLATIFIAPGVIRAAAITSITTTPGGTLFLGSGTRLTDSAMLSGGVSPTGSMTFELFGPTNAVLDTETVSVAGNGTYNTPIGLVPTAAGTYEWVATYSGDSNNLQASSAKGNEPESVILTSPQITTTAGGAVVLGSGSRLTDSANLFGGLLPSGTITFELFDPTNFVVDTETVSVNGNGTYPTPVGLVPTVAGTYEWVAAYSGDSFNFAVSSGLGNEPESAVSPASVPEPSSMALICVAAAAMGLFRRRRKKAQRGASQTVGQH
jgi:hypothetical protein